VATAETPSSITDLPPEGLRLREALELSPFWAEHKHFELLRIRIQTGAIRAADLSGSDKLHLVVYGQAAWDRVIGWLLDLLESGVWVLTAYRSEKLWGEPERFGPTVVRRLSFDKDNDTVRGPTGQLFYGPCIHSAATTALKPKWSSQSIAAAEQPEKAPKTADIRSNKQWLEWAKQNVLPDGREHGWKTRYAKKLESAMKQAAKANKSIKPMPAASIAARMREIGWPETDDETTTK
jgi:hypothetical protein